MTRLASLDIDIGIEPPAQWSDDWVQIRLVEAYRIERRWRLPGWTQYFNGGNTWPATLDSFADRVYQGEVAREAVWDKWERSSTVTAAELTRMDQAQEWLRVYLASHPAERTCLAHWATAIAFGRSMRALMIRRRWSRSTFIRRVDEGSRIITASLIADDVAVT